MLDNLNNSWFLLLNAHNGDADIVRLAAVFLAQYLNWVVGLALTAYLLATKQPKLWLKLLGSCAVALVLAYVIGKLYYHPRPFILGLGQTVVGQHDTSSFPSRHLTFYWALVLPLCGFVRTRRLGLGLVVLGLIEAWARIYVGVHYPLDMVGSLLVALVASSVVWYWGGGVWAASNQANRG